MAAGFLLPGLVLLAYGWSLFNSPSFGSLADQPYHLALAREYEQAMQAGEVPPRWAAGLNGGRGAPTFVVYPPFFSMLTAVLMSLTESPRNALRAAVLITAMARVSTVLSWLQGVLGLVEAESQPRWIRP